jgi:hypothetical protein
MRFREKVYHVMRNYMFIFIFIAVNYSNVFAQWKQNEFIIGTFADPRLSGEGSRLKDSISFKQAADAGFNLLSGPQFYLGGRDFTMMNRTLDLAYEFGFKLFVIDHRLKVSNDSFSKAKADTIINYFKNVNLARQQALYGYYFGGEFPVKDSEKVLNWLAYFKNKDSDRLPYYYLLPVIAFKSRGEYEYYLDTYLNNKNVKKRPEVVSYDYYPFKKDGSVRSDYFYNLRIVKNKAGKRPFWCYILTTQHGNYPDPDAYQLAFSAFCPIAYGSKGLLYFSYETIPGRYGGDYKDAIIGRNGKPTVKYEIVKNINNYIKNIIGPVVMTSKYIGTYHMSSQPTKEIFDEKNLVNKKTPYVKSISNDNIMVGIFQSSIRRGDKYLFFVNKSATSLNNVKVSLNGNFAQRIFAMPGMNSHSGENKSIPLDGDFYSSTNLTDFYISLSPGEGKMIEIRNPTK